MSGAERSGPDAGAQSGAELARRYHDEVVAPLLLGRWPGLRYAAARLGSGSDVLGYDDTTSRDHDWGLRLNVLVDPAQVDAVRAHLRDALPQSYAGRPTRFGTTWAPRWDIGVQVDGPGEFASSRLGLDPSDGLDVQGWLSLTGQSVLEVVAGPVFVDTAGDLTRLRSRLRWYPDDVWRYVVAADWSRLAQELPVAGRAGERGDDIGSRVVMGRLVGTALHLGFLLERRWPPYPKWRGVAFAGLACAPGVGPALSTALSAGGWQERERGLQEALAVLLDAQRAAGLPAPQRATQPFFDRPYLTVAEGVVPALREGVGEPVGALPWGVGSVEQWVDSVDVLSHAHRRVAAAGLLREHRPGHPR